MTENPFRADVDNYLRAAALNAPPPPINSDPLAAGLSPVEQLLRILGLAANADDPQDELESLEAFTERDLAALTAADQFSAQDDTAARQFAALQQLPQLFSGIAAAAGGAVAGFLQPLGQVSQQLTQAGQQVLQGLSAAVEPTLLEPAAGLDEVADVFGPDGGAALPGDLSGSGGWDDPGGSAGSPGGFGPQSTGPAGTLAPPAIPSPGTAPAAGPPAPPPPRAAAAVPGPIPAGMPFVPPIAAAGGPDKDDKPEPKRVAVPPVRNGAPVQGRVTMTPPAVSVTRTLNGKPVTARRVEPADRPD